MHSLAPEPSALLVLSSLTSPLLLFLLRSVFFWSSLIASCLTPLQSQCGGHRGLSRTNLLLEPCGGAPWQYEVQTSGNDSVLASRTMPFLLVQRNFPRFSRGVLFYIPLSVLLLSRMFSLQPQFLMAFAWWTSAHLELLSSSFTTCLKPCQASPRRADKIFLEPLLYPMHDSITSSVTSLFPPPGPLGGHGCALTSLVSLVLISTMSGTEGAQKHLLNKLINYRTFKAIWVEALENVEEGRIDIITFED